MKRAFLAVFVLCIVAACGGGGGGGSAVPPSKQPSGQTGKAAITIVVPSSAKSASTLRTPKYIVPGTQSVAIQVISVDGVTPNPPLAPTIAQIGPNAPGCTTISTGVSCTINVNVPYATSLILQISSFASTDGSGNALAVGTLGPIDSTNPNATPFPVALGGNIASIQASPGAFSPVVDGTTQQFTFTVSAKDSSGNLILPPGNYPVPITFAVSNDPNSAISFSPSSITAPPANGITTVTMTFNSAKTIGATTIVASAGTPTASMNFTPLGTGGGTLNTGYHVLEFSLPTANSGPWGITSGPGGTIWFTENASNKIGEVVSPSSCSTGATCKIIEGPLGNSPGPTGIAFGADGNAVVGGSVYAPSGSSILVDVAAGCGGASQNFVLCSTNSITDPFANPSVYDVRTQLGGNIALAAQDPTANTNGGVGVFNPTNPGGMATANGGLGTGPFGLTSNGWATIPSQNLLMSYSCSDGCGVTTYAFSPGGNPQGILYGNNTMTYVADAGNNAITSFLYSTCSAGAPGSCTYTTAVIPTQNSAPEFLTTGADGNVWFTEYNGNKIGVLKGGTIYEITIPTTNAGAWGITLGPDGNVWFTERTSGKIGVVVP